METRNTFDDQNLHKHETFYCAVQTCCYIVCYHGVSLGSLIRDSPIDQGNWELAMSSKYQPIKFCLQSVRVEFLRLAREIDMFPSVSDQVARLTLCVESHSNLNYFFIGKQCCVSSFG
jgi:hypothetical protein